MKFKLFLESFEQALQISKEVANSLHCEMGGSCIAFAHNATFKLLENGITNFIVVEGWVKDKNERIWRQHTWLEMDGQKIDPTFIQFNNKGLMVTYVSRVKKRYTPEEYIKLDDLYPDELEYRKRFLK